MHLCRQLSYVNRSQRLNVNEILYFGAVLIGLFDLTCVDAVIALFTKTLLGNIICTKQKAKVLIRLTRQ